MSASRGSEFTLSHQLFARKRANRFKQTEVIIAPSIFFALHQTLVDEPPQDFQHIGRLGSELCGNGLGCFERERTCKDTQAAKYDLLVGREKIVTPGNGRSKRLLPFG